MSEVERVLAMHRRIGRVRCSCGVYFRASVMDDAAILVEHDAHVADQIEPLIVERERAARAEAWDEGYEASEDDGAQWDATIGTHRPATNPYRANRLAQDAPESAPTAPLTASEASGGDCLRGDQCGWILCKVHSPTEGQCDAAEFQIRPGIVTRPSGWIGGVWHPEWPPIALRAPESAGETPTDPRDAAELLGRIERLEGLS